jgi:hypothetical protein
MVGGDEESNDFRRIGGDILDTVHEIILLVL